MSNKVQHSSTGKFDQKTRDWKMAKCRASLEKLYDAELQPFVVVNMYLYEINMSRNPPNFIRIKKYFYQRLLNLLCLLYAWNWWQPFRNAKIFNHGSVVVASRDRLECSGRWLYLLFCFKTVQKNYEEFQQLYLFYKMIFIWKSRCSEISTPWIFLEFICGWSFNWCRFSNNFPVNPLSLLLLRWD